MPIASLTTLANGARQFVVHDALEMTSCCVGVVLVEVDAEDDRDVLALGRRGDDDLLRAAGEVLGGVLAVGEEAGRLDDDVDAEVAPRAGRPGSRSARTLQLLAVDDQAGVVGLDRARVGPEDRVVLQQRARASWGRSGR